MRLRGLTDTKEGRLVVIVVTASTLMIAVALGNLAVAGAADSAAEDVRRALRHELATVSDEVLARYPDSADTIEEVAVAAVRHEPARVLGTARAEGGDVVVVAVQSGWGWHVRCIEAELRGRAVVLTYVRSRPC